MACAYKHDELNFIFMHDVPHVLSNVLCASCRNRSADLRRISWKSRRLAKHPADWHVLIAWRNTESVVAGSWDSRQASRALCGLVEAVQEAVHMSARKKEVVISSQ